MIGGELTGELANWSGLNAQTCSQNTDSVELASSPLFTGERRQTGKQSQFASSPHTRSVWRRRALGERTGKAKKKTRKATDYDHENLRIAREIAANPDQFGGGAAFPVVWARLVLDRLDGHDTESR